MSLRRRSVMSLRRRSVMSLRRRSVVSLRRRSVDTAAIDALVAKPTIDVELTLGEHLVAPNAEVFTLDGLTEANRGVDPRALVVGLARSAALASTAHAPWLTFVLGAEGLGAGVRDALELRAVLVIGTLRVIAAVREARFVQARAASTVRALLRFRTRLVDAGEQALPIDADAGLAALEVELA